MGDRNGTGNRTRHMRRRVVPDLPDQPAARPRAADLLEPAGGLDRELDLDRDRQCGIGGKQHEVRTPQPRPPVGQLAEPRACDRGAGLELGGAQSRLPPHLATARGAQARPPGAHTAPNAASSRHRPAPGRAARARPTPAPPWSRCTTPAGRRRVATGRAGHSRRAGQGAGRRPCARHRSGPSRPGR